MLTNGGVVAIGGGRVIDRDELQRAVAYADPAALLAPARILRRVIKRDRRLKFFGGGAARLTCYPIAGAALGAIVSAEELGRRGGEPWPETVYLLACPDPEEIAEFGPDLILTTAWRRLFRARVVDLVRKAFDSGRVDEAGLAARVEAIGRAEFEEARAVLAQDGWTHPEAGDAATYGAFAAVFLDLTRFASSLRGYTFPAVEDPAAVLAVLAEDVDAPGLLAATRPLGAPDPVEPDEDADDPEHDGEFVAPGEARGASPARASRGRVRTRRLDDQAGKASALGNNVRAAILSAGAALAGGPEAVENARTAARAELKHLADRFTRALFVRRGEAETWAAALTPLLRRASHEFWSPEARLLYDVQKVCTDHEREVFRIDLVDWARSLGKRPWKRPLPHVRAVAMCNHLRRAAGRLPRVRVSREERGRLEGLLRSALHRVEHDVREQFRPTVDATLAAHWVAPRDLPERVASGKLVEELLDRIVGRGFSTLGDLRDAASQSHLKLPDLSGPGEFFHGDRLLQTDRALAERLDGVHRQGEIYLRWLQRFSALAFGTRAGRWFTRYVALPYGGAFVLIKGLLEIDELLVSRLTRVHHHVTHAQIGWGVLLVGSVALGAINFSGFRRGLWGAVRGVGRALRSVFVDLPAWILYNPMLLRVLGSEVVWAVWTVFVKPGLVAGAVGGASWLAGLDGAGASGVAAASFLAACLVFNTSAGRAIEEAVAEEVVRGLRVVSFEIVPGLFQIVMSAFARLLEWVEKLIYAVDEWLRFRNGQSGGVLGVKAALGVVWAAVAYLVRFCVTLLVEPQVNPIKHFPVVTVSHKLILPTIPHFVKLLTPVLGRDWSLFVTGTTGLLLPGVFGFLVWELKSNWQLYEANRPEALGPVIVGSHGETVAGLLRPGFHSGTLPKLYGRLRKARRGGREGAALKRREGLHHVEESMRRFIERDLVALLREARSLGRPDLRAGAIHLATNRIRFELLAGARDGPGLWVDLEERAGVLSATLLRPGWMSALDADGRRALDDALAGFYKMSGVELVLAPGRSLSLADAVVGWRDWVDTWESDRDGSHPRRRGVRGKGWPGVLAGDELERAPS